MKLSELDYELPQELIAQHPPERRDDSPLLVYERETGEIRHRRFSELPEELEPQELVVVNDTRVLPARIRIERPRGEVLLLARAGGDGGGEGVGVGRTGAAAPAAWSRCSLRPGRADRAPGRGALAAQARWRAGRGDAA